jgi:hypothetical protein
MMVSRERKSWDSKEDDCLVELLNKDVSYDTIADILGRTTMAIGKRIGALKEDSKYSPQLPEHCFRRGRKPNGTGSGVVEDKELAEEKPDEPPPPRPDSPARAIPEEVQALEDRVRELEAEKGVLVQQLTWAQHARSEERTGGIITLRRSDDHHGDKNHMLSCAKSLEGKFCVLVEQYKPDRIRIIAGDDWIVGSGIYKEQDSDSVNSDVSDQMAVGAMKARDFVASIRSVSDAPIEWLHLRGNHEFARGISISRELFLYMRSASEDLGVQWVFSGDSITCNLADKGIYNVLVKHGYGYSKHSPNSPGFIESIKDELIVKQSRMMPEETYRRIISGHTHWMSVGIERQLGVHWDTTGGLQKNTRVRIGDNQRPPGWIAYVSPKDMESNILSPIGLTPDQDVLLREIEDQNLDASNLRDFADCQVQLRQE